MTADLKRTLRRQCLARRDELNSGLGEARKAALARTLAEQITGEPGLVPPQAVLASYRAMGAELDPEPAEDLLRRRGHQIALPVTPPIGQPLTFRLWAPGEPLITHRFGMREPAPSAAEVRPGVLLVPLLAFDRQGHRLGYGGGYYDRTLAQLRSGGSGTTHIPKAIGIAFSEQEVDAVPHEAYDQRLDAVATPDGIIKCNDLDS